MSFMKIFLGVNVLDYPATSPDRFETQTFIGTHEGAVRDENVAGSAAHFAANHKASVAGIDRIVTDDAVLGGHSPFTAFFILAGFDANRIVTHVEGTAFDQEILAGFDVHPVAIVGVFGIFGGDVPDGQILTHERMQTPGPEFWKVIPSSSTFLQLLNTTRLGRRKSFISAKSCGLSGGQQHAFVFLTGRFELLTGIPGFAIVFEHSARGYFGLPLAFGQLPFVHSPPYIAIAIHDALSGNGYIFQIHPRNRATDCGRRACLRRILLPVRTGFCRG